MKLKIIFAFALSMGALAGCASGAGESRDVESTERQVSGATSNFTDGEKDKKTCKIGTVTGSKVRKRRTCMTTREQEMVSRRSSDVISRQIKTGRLGSRSR